LSRTSTPSTKAKPNARRATRHARFATQFLTEDFLAPALASLIFVDTPSSFLPDLGQHDRGTAVKKALSMQAAACWRDPF
jgi:hypothetical protein